MSGIYATFFGQDGSQKLSLSMLEKFLNRLHLELVRLEFSFYDEKSTVRVLLVACALHLSALTSPATMRRTR